MGENRQSGEPASERELGGTLEFVPLALDSIETSIAICFERQARRHPERLAVKTRSANLTYDALNRAANCVARAILADSKQGEEPIALLFKPGASLIVANLAVLKAGKSFVPLDHSLPPVKLSQILKDFEPRLVLTDGVNLALARELAGEGARAEHR